MVISKTITHSTSGAKATIYDFGATVTSFQAASGRQCLFVSRDAKLDGTKAVRGGIPLVFPQFGQPDTSMPQHGFLRNNTWQFQQEHDTPETAGISLTLELENVVNARGGNWAADSTPYKCKFVYSIEIQDETMTTTLEIQNTSTDKDFEFQTLQHTYFAVDGHAAQDASQCHVSGLEGYTVVDKITKEAEYPCGKDPVTIPELVDRVYNPPGDKPEVNVTIAVGGGKTIELKAKGNVDGTSVPVSCVVWNPYKDKAAEMGDFGDDQYVDMICVEPGILGNENLPAGTSAKLVQVMTLK